MIYEILHKLDQKVHFDTVKAHCDIPCGIYDPIIAQINALTVVRMLDLMAEFVPRQPTKQGVYIAWHAVAVKEEHAERAKAEIRVIWEII
jgi:nickel superoxide dismutase